MNWKIKYYESLAGKKILKPKKETTHYAWYLPSFNIKGKCSILSLYSLFSDIFVFIIVFICLFIWRLQWWMVESKTWALLVEIQH